MNEDPSRALDELLSKLEHLGAEGLVEEIRHAVFDPSCLQERDEFRTFWQQVHDGGGEGILGR